MLWPTRGTLGRDPTPGRTQGHPLNVERADATKLLAELDADFVKEVKTRVYNDYMNMEFVHSDQSFHAFRTCNTVMIAWLRRLGCDVSGSGLSTDWKFIE